MPRSLGAPAQSPPSFGLVSRALIPLLALLLPLTPRVALGAQADAPPEIPPEAAVAPMDPPPPPAKAADKAAPKGDPEERERAYKFGAGVFVGVLAGMGLGVVDYGVSRLVFRAVDGDPEGLGAFVVISSPYVAYAVGAAGGAAFAVHRYGGSLGHGGRILPTLGGSILGAAVLGGGLALAARGITGARADAGVDADAFGAMAIGLALGSTFGGSAGAVLGYELSDPRTTDAGLSLRILPAPLIAGPGAPLVPGLRLAGTF